MNTIILSSSSPNTHTFIVGLICLIAVNLTVAQEVSYRAIIDAAFKESDKLHVMGSVIAKKKKLDVDMTESSKDKIDRARNIFLSYSPKYTGKVVEEAMEGRLSVTYMCFEVSTKQKTVTIAFPTWRTIIVDGRLEFSTDDPKFFSELARLYFKEPE